MPAMRDFAGQNDIFGNRTSRDAARISTFFDLRISAGDKFVAYRYPRRRSFGLLGTTVARV
jgi:hypothetical protein